MSIIAAIGIFGVLITLNQDTTTQEETPPSIDTSNTTVTKIKSTQADYEYNLENSKNAKLMPENPINKDVFPGHVFGFIVDNGLRTGMGSNSLSNVDEKFSIRFTSKFSGDITKLFLVSNGPQNVPVKIGLQKDDGGFPNGVWMGGPFGFVETLINAEDQVYDAINLEIPISLKENEIYHIVVELEESSDKPLYLISYHKNWPINSFNHIDPDTVLEDNAINTLFFDGSTWSVQNKWPIFVVEFSNGLSDGQPYSLMAPWVIKESSMVGQTVRPFSDYLIDEFAFVVSLQGSPLDNLYYEVYDEKNNILRNGLFATPEDLSTKKSWHQVKLESPLSLESGSLYRFILSSPNTDLDNPYKIYGHEFMLDRSLGYGSVNHHLTKSSNGIQWSKWYDADTSFMLITK